MNCNYLSSRCNCWFSYHLRSMGLDWSITIMPYGPRLRKQRAFLHQYLQPSAIKQHHHILKLETHRLITSLFDSPENYAFHIRRYSFPNFSKENNLRTILQDNSGHYHDDSIRSQKYPIFIYITYCLTLTANLIIVAPEGDIYVKLADQVMESFSIAGEPGAFLVDFFPACMSLRFRPISQLIIYLGSEIRPCVVPWSKIQAQGQGLV